MSGPVSGAANEAPPPRHSHRRSGQLAVRHRPGTRTARWGQLAVRRRPGTPTARSHSFRRARPRSHWHTPARSGSPRHPCAPRLAETVPVIGGKSRMTVDVVHVSSISYVLYTYLSGFVTAKSVKRRRHQVGRPALATRHDGHDGNVDAIAGPLGPHRRSRLLGPHPRSRLLGPHRRSRLLGPHRCSRLLGLVSRARPRHVRQSPRAYVAADDWCRPAGTQLPQLPPRRELCHALRRPAAAWPWAPQGGRCRTPAAGQGPVIVDPGLGRASRPK
jgi:hypothetical protein